MKLFRFLLIGMNIQLIVHAFRGYEVFSYALFVVFFALVVAWGEWKELADG